MKREKVAPINLRAGDSLQLSYTEFGKRPIVLATHTFTEDTTISEVEMFQIYEDGQHGLGGIFWEEPK